MGPPQPRGTPSMRRDPISVMVPAMTTTGLTGVQIAATVGAAAGAYLLGSVNFSLLAARLLGHGDLRRHGSGNAGATNLARVAGKGAAAAVLALDIGRGAAVVLAAALFGFGALAPFAALPLLLGNLFPLFHGFKGGKGVAAAVGAVLAISPLAMLAGGAVFLGVFGAWRRVSAGSIAMALAYPTAVWLLGGARADLTATACVAAILVASHRRNIARLARGEEPRLAFGRRGENGEGAP
jgi:acyl phosphate:glycerol-3-phosphate acyltransferase